LKTLAAKPQMAIVTPPRRELVAVLARRDQAAKELADTQDAIAPAKRIVAEAERVLAQPSTRPSSKWRSVPPKP
jgi:hypothetical protein